MASALPRSPARELHVYGFNFTALDMAKSRSFGVVTRNARLVAEAIKLYEADTARQAYSAAHRLAAFIKGARRQLLIYDPQLTDDAMLEV